MKLLLRHPSLTTLTLNHKDMWGDSPVIVAVVMDGRLEHLKELAADLMVDLDTTDKQGRSLEEDASDSEIVKIQDKAKERRNEFKEVRFMWCLFC